MKLALRMVKTPGARPAVRAAEHRLRAKIIRYAFQLIGRQIQRLLPANSDVLICAAARIRARAVLQPAFTYHRLRDTRRVAQRISKVFQQRAGIGIAGKRRNLQLVAAIEAVNAPSASCG